MTALRELKMGRIGYIIYQLDSKLENVQVKEKGAFANHDELLDKMPKADAAYVAVDFQYSVSEGEAKRHKIILISWCPEGTGIKVSL